MTCITKIKNFVFRADLFASNTTFRVRGQSNYQSICGGVLSLFILSAFIGVFAQQFLSVLMKYNLEVTVQLVQDTNFTQQVKDIYFAFKISGIDLTENNQKLGVQLFKNQRISGSPINNSTEQLELGRCSIQKFKQLDPSLENNYKNYKLQQGLCPKQGQDLKIFGYNGNQEVFQFLTLTIGYCRGNAYQLKDQNLTCMDFIQANIFFGTYLTSQIIVEGKIFMVQSTVRANNQSYPVVKSLFQQTKMLFSLKSGTIAYLSLANFNIQTDQSIMPWNQFTYQDGHYVQSQQSRTIQLLTDPNVVGIISPYFGYINIQKSPKQLNIGRSYRKIDDMLSYAGGLFGIIIGFLMFIMNDYNQYNYQLLVSQGSFEIKPDERQKQFGFFSYLGYKFYETISSFGCEIPWSRMKRINSVRQQINQQLDVRLILKKLNYLQRVTDVLLDQHQKISLYFTKLPTIEQHIKNRQKFEQSEKVLLSIIQKQHQKKKQMGLDLISSILENKRIVQIQPNLNTTKKTNKKVYPININSQVFSLNQSIQQMKEAKRNDNNLFFQEEGYETNLQNNEKQKLQIPQFLLDLAESMQNPNKITKKILAKMPSQIVQILKQYPKYKKNKNPNFLGQKQMEVEKQQNYL